MLPSVRLELRGMPVFGLPTLSGDWQGGTNDISQQEEEEGSVTEWTRKPSPRLKVLPRAGSIIHTESQ